MRSIYEKSQIKPKYHFQKMTPLSLPKNLATLGKDVKGRSSTGPPNYQFLRQIK
jgi:hypothetical protein